MLNASVCYDHSLVYSDLLQFIYRTIIAERFYYICLGTLPISTILFDGNNGTIQQQAAVANRSGSSSRMSNSANNSYSEKRDRSRTYSCSSKKQMTTTQAKDKIQQLKDEIGYLHNEIDGLNADITDIKSKHFKELSNYEMKI